MDFNTQYQIPQQPEPVGGKGKMIGFTIAGIIVVLFGALILWIMMSGDASAPVTENTPPAVNLASTPAPKSDEVNDLDQEASAFNAAGLDSDLEGEIESDLAE
ncbi:MAG: hypothetical protein M3Q73_02210 [bacterium]|nr:hypothetical protein [bacterium]